MEIQIRSQQLINICIQPRSLALAVHWFEAATAAVVAVPRSNFDARQVQLHGNSN